MSDQLQDAAPLKGKRCLVLEDEFLIAIDIGRILESLGAVEAVCTQQTDEALAEIAKAPFDFAVLDFKLEAKDSLEVAGQLQARAVPFVFVTGAPPNATDLSRFPGVPVLEKPFELAALKEAIARLLGP